MKYTPGPWVIGEFDELKTANGKILKVRGIASPLSGYSDAENEEFAANARLISAAPELLEALKVAKQTIAIFHGKPQWDIYDRCSPEMKLINAAITKATGVKP